MTKPIIEIQGIGKRYRIGAQKEPYLSLRDELAKTGRRIVSAITHRSPIHRTPDLLYSRMYFSIVQR